MSVSPRARYYSPDEIHALARRVRALVERERTIRVIPENSIRLGWRDWLLFALIVVDHGRRQLLWFAVTRHPTAEWLAQQITQAFPWDTAPAYLIRDNDRAYGQVFTKRLLAMGIRDRPISPSSPWQNAYVERLIGTLRRDCLDHILIFGERHLRKVLKAYALYYDETRTHLGLNKDAPLRRATQRSGTIAATPVLSGLHHRYARI